MSSQPVESFLKKVLMSPVRLLLAVEGYFYKVREVFWNYPDWLFLDKESVRATSWRAYMLLRPFSHFAFAVLLFLLVALLSANFSSRPLFARHRQILIEGVVMGADATGRMQRLAKVNPLVPSAIQLERDLSELIYEPLFRYEQGGNAVPVLADNIIRIAEGSVYEFELKQGVSWHDGEEFGVEDVIATLELMRGLEISDNTYVQAVKQMAWERSGANSIIICVVSEASRTNLATQNLDRPCTFHQGEHPILSNFLELLSIKIMPAHHVKELNALNINDPSPRINRFPIGTGPYKFVNSSFTGISLTRNNDYYDRLPNISDINFKFFVSEDGAVKALQNGEIHSLVTVSTINARNMAAYKHLEVVQSPVLRNQYWAIYFNLRKNPEGESVGASFFQDVQVRKAINMAINKTRVIDSLLGVGEVADGPIYRESDFYASDAKWLDYDPAEASRLLSEAGWLPGPDGIRMKGEERLSFELSYSANFDREKTVQTIKQDLFEIGVELRPDPRSSKDLVDQVVSAKLFDSLLYGMSTFIDPDRYELFHSEQITGLNLSGYEGSVETVQIKDRASVTVPKVDRLLELGRQLDPLQSKDKRQETYVEFQELLADDAPAIFLYHPKFIYYINNRLNGVDLGKSGNLEQRFSNIFDWQII